MEAIKVNGHAMEENVRNTLQDQYLTFRLADEEYGLEICFVKEVVGLMPVTMMPGMPGYIKGVVNLRGSLIPIMDARIRFNLTEVEYGDRTCVIVIDVNGEPLGLAVDEVKDVLEIPNEKVTLSMTKSHTGKDGLLKGFGKIDDYIKIIIDAQKLMDLD